MKSKRSFRKNGGVSTRLFITTILLIQLVNVIIFFSFRNRKGETDCPLHDDVPTPTPQITHPQPIQPVKQIVPNRALKDHENVHADLQLYHEIIKNSHLWKNFSHDSHPLLQKPGLPKECKDYIINGRKKQTYVSQFGQDWMLYEWLYRSSPKKGIYVDVGANSPKHLSNTYFFDYCMGWSGLCIEMNAQNARKISQNNHRSCKVINKCVSSKSETIKYSESGAHSRILDKNDGGAVGKCDTLENILRENGIEEFDYLTIDIEGAELKALSGFDFNDFNVQVIVIEMDKSPKELRWSLEDQGYWKVKTVADDFIYIKGLPVPHPKDADLGWNRWKATEERPNLERQMKELKKFSSNWF